MDECKTQIAFRLSRMLWLTPLIPDQIGVMMCLSKTCAPHFEALQSRIVQTHTVAVHYSSPSPSVTSSSPQCFVQ